MFKIIITIITVVTVTTIAAAIIVGIAMFLNEQERKKY
jgi:hypothetical protein